MTHIIALYSSAGYDILRHTVLHVPIMLYVLRSITLEIQDTSHPVCGTYTGMHGKIMLQGNKT